MTPDEPAAARADAVREALLKRDAEWREAINEGIQHTLSSAIIYSPKLYALYTKEYAKALAASPEGTPTETAEQLPKGDKP